MTVHVWSKRCAPADEDAWHARLALAGEDNVITTSLRGQKSVRLDVYQADAARAEALRRLFGGKTTVLKDENWATLSNQPPILVKVRDRLLITSEVNADALADVRTAHPNRTVLSIPPELAFGTGDHATTANCLRLLTDVARKHRNARWSMLDLGTGTGVLAIAAKCLGAQRVEGWENDRLAIDVAKRNVLANGWQAKDIPIRNRDVLEWEPTEVTWDVIAANLFSEILISIFAKIRRVLTPAGTLIISGILEDQAKETFAAAEDAGFTFTTIKQRGKWIAART